jgi:hypothetical protein
LNAEEDDQDYYKNLKRKEERRKQRRKVLAEEASDSDQEYDEYVTRMGGGREDSDEEQKPLHGLKNPRTRGFKGARSLQNAAIECILQNISDITLEGIECLPISIVRRLWDAINKRSVCLPHTLFNSVAFLIS